MQVDKLWMEHWFAIFNKEYFDGELPLPRLALSRSRTRLGSMACKRVKRLFKSEKFTDFAIRLSNFYDLSEREFQNVLLHEMIHLKIAFLGMKDTAPHGVVFRRMADELNRNSGWNIRVTGSTRGVKPAQPQPSSDYLVLALLLDSGEYFFSVVNPRYARGIDREIRMVSRVKNFNWYTTRDGYFMNFPKVRSLRGRRVSAEIFKEKTAAMTKITVLY